MMTSCTWPSRWPAGVTRISLRVTLQGRESAAAAVAHAGAQAADELVNHRRDAALVRDAALDPLGHELLGRLRVRIEIELVLEVAVAAAAAHRAERSHAAVFLEAAALVENHLARALVGAGEQAADHRRSSRRPRSPW